MKFKEMTLLQLKAYAKEKGIRGISTLKKEQLVEKLMESEKYEEKREEKKEENIEVKREENRKENKRANKEEKKKGMDMLWYIWINGNSPVFGKDRMTTFERYLIADKETHKEVKNPYYTYMEKEETVNQILEEFGLDTKDSHIINGHMPVKVSKGETPVKCNGKLLIIDGGFSKAYQKVTGIAGYTLVYNSYGLMLVAHEPFVSVEEAVVKETDIHSVSMVVERTTKRLRVADTDAGKELEASIRDLEKLVAAYRAGESRAER